MPPSPPLGLLPAAPARTAAPVDRPPTTGAKRFVLATLGVLFVGIAIVGVLLPGIPTTGPLIAASCLLTKSCPALERKLLGLRLFRGYRHYLDGSTPMPMRARYWALGWMWTSILISAGAFLHSGQTGSWLAAAVIAMGGIGTIVILRFRREVRRVAEPGAFAPPPRPASDDAEEPLLNSLQEIHQILDEAHAMTHPGGSPHLPNSSFSVEAKESLSCTPS